MKNAAALHQARALAVDGLLAFATVAERIWDTRPADAAQLVASARAHALDVLATFGTCLALAHVEMGPLPRVAEDVALGLLGAEGLREAAAFVGAISLPRVEAAA